MLQPMKRLHIPARLLGVTVSGALVALLFPPWNLGGLVWLALIPMLIVLWTLPGSRSIWRGALYGGGAGLVSNLIQFHWFGVVAPVAGGLVPAYLALYWSAFGAFAATLGNPWRNAPADADSLSRILRSLRFGFCNAAVWAGLEWLRGWLLTGFGWNGLAIAFHQTAALAQCADLLGATALSMVPVFLQSVLLQTGERMRETARSGKRQTRLDFAVAAMLVGLLLCYGLARIAGEKARPTIRLKALLVQINIPQQATEVLWEPHEIHQAYEQETSKALEAIVKEDEARLKAQLDQSQEGEIRTLWPDWVLWPEAALSGCILTMGDGSWGTSVQNTQTIATVRERGPFQLIQGIPVYEGTPREDGLLGMKQGGKGWNSLAVLSPTDELQLYHKHHLVWFGETIPLLDQLPWLKSIYESQSGMQYNGSFTPGTSFEPLPIPLANGEVIHAIPSVCYEDSVPRLARRFVRPQTQIIVNVTNDGWFKESAAAEQHFATAKFRCIELRRPMIRCANSGISAAIDSTGSIAHPDTGTPQLILDDKGSHFTRGSRLVEVDIPKQPSITLYMIIGDWGVIGASLSGLILAWALRKR